jgi:uncharacterized membrane protein YadS
MRHLMMRSFGKRLIVAGLAICGLSVVAATAHACPMCSQSIAEEDLLPHAYMYSILFMLTMPAMVFGGIGSVIYFKFRKFSAHQAATESPAEPAPVSDARDAGLS